MSSKLNRYDLRYVIALILIVLPLDALQYLPGEYSPLSGFLAVPFFLIAFYYIAIKQRINREVFLIYGFFFVAYIFSILKAMRLGNYSGFLDFFSSSIVGLIFYSVTVLYFEFVRDNSSDNIDFIHRVTKVIYPLYFIAVVFGLLQLGGRFVGPLEKVVTVITGIVSNSRSEIQLLTAEPSWAAAHLFFFLPYLRLLYIIEKKPIYNWLALSIALLILLMFSLSAYVYAMIIGFFYFFSTSKRKFLVLFVFILILILAGLTVVQLINMLTRGLVAGRRQIVRFRDLVEQRSLLVFLQFSSSETVRIGFPMAGFLELQEDPLFGVGGGNSRFYIAKYLYPIMPWAEQMWEVRKYLHPPGSGGTPRNLLARIVGETGLIGLFLFSLFVIRSFKRIRYCKEYKVRKLLVLIIVVSFVITLQFDSFAYALLWFNLAFFQGIRKEQTITSDKTLIEDETI